MAHSFDYAAYSVCNGEVDFISPVHTRETAKNLVDYWKKSAHLTESFYCKKGNIPAKFKKSVEEYWQEYEKAHPKQETETDPDALPW